MPLDLESQSSYKVNLTLSLNLNDGSQLQHAIKETPDQPSTSILSYKTALELNLITMRINKLSEEPEVNSSVLEHPRSSTANDIHQSKNVNVFYDGVTQKHLKV